MRGVGVYREIIIHRHIKGGGEKFRVGGGGGFIQNIAGYRGWLTPETGGGEGGFVEDIAGYRGWHAPRLTIFITVAGGGGGVTPRVVVVTALRV